MVEGPALADYSVDNRGGGKEQDERKCYSPVFKDDLEKPAQVRRAVLAS